MKDQWRWKKKTQKKNKESDKRPTRKKKRENAFLCKWCWNATETIAEESIDERRAGNQKGTWNAKKGFGPLAFSFFRVQTMYCGPRKDLFIVACRLQCSLLLLNDLCLLLINQVVLGHAGAGLDRHYRCPLFWPCPDSAVHGCSHW